MEGAVDEGVDGCRGTAEEEDGFLQVLAQLLAGVEEHEDDHGDVVRSPADQESEDDDHCDHQRFDLGLPQDFLPRIVDGRMGHPL